VAKAQGEVRNLGPIGETVAANMRDLRGSMTYAELSQRLAAIGRPIAVLGLSRIESGARRVDADDLVALALAFGVSPVRLLLPTDDRDSVELAKDYAAPWSAAWAWLRGDRPLSGDDVEDFERAHHPDRPRVDSRDVLRWDDHLDPIREALRRVVDGDGVPVEVVQLYVKFWANLRGQVDAHRRAGRDLQAEVDAERARQAEQGGDDAGR
jgi:transcriptional regulator with XRE-family HTH domain